MIHGLLQNNGVKMSKSLGNVVAPADLVAQYGLDQVRYFFLREVPFGADGNYSHEAIVGRMNSDLANNFGNLAQRSLSMVAKNCEGRRPRPRRISPPRTPRCWARPTDCWTSPGPRSRSRSSAAPWRPSGPSWATPTPTSPSRRRGCCGRPTSNA